MRSILSLKWSRLLLNFARAREPSLAQWFSKLCMAVGQLVKMVGDPKKAFDLVTSVSTVRGLAVHWHQWRVSPVWRVMIYNQHFLAWLPEVTFLPKPKSDAQRQRYARLCGHQMFSRIEHEECTLPHSSGILKIFQLLHVALRPEQSLGLGAILSKQCVLQRVLACFRQASLLRILCIGDDLAEETKQFMMRYQRSDDKDLEALKANGRVVGVFMSSTIREHLRHVATCRRVCSEADLEMQQDENIGTNQCPVVAFVGPLPWWAMLRPREPALDGSPTPSPAQGVSSTLPALH